MKSVGRAIQPTDRTLAIPLLDGRDFTDADFEQQHILIVTQAFERQNRPGSVGPRAQSDASGSRDCVALGVVEFQPGGRQKTAHRRKPWDSRSKGVKPWKGVRSPYAPFRGWP